MEACTLRITIEPWDDRGFNEALERVCGRLRAGESVMDSAEAAERAQRLLREAGYPRAVIEHERTVRDYLAHTARWTVRREGPNAVEKSAVERRTHPSTGGRAAERLGAGLPATR